MFKIYDSDVGFKLDSTTYYFDHVDEITVEDPGKNRLTRGINATNKKGLVYKEGAKDAETWTIPILNMTPALKAALDSAFKKESRIDVFIISRTDGSKKTMNQAILCQKPQQMTVSDTAEALQVKLVFESFDTNEVLKS